MPEMTDGLVYQLKQIIKIPSVEYVVLDNGSDKAEPPKSTTHRVETNLQSTGGFNYLAGVAKEKGADYVWFFTNDVYFKTLNDPLESMINKIISNPKIGIIHPSMTEYEEWFNWMWNDPAKHGVTTGHKYIDFVAPLYTAEAMKANDWSFDTQFISWGHDQDSSLRARMAGLTIAVDQDIELYHEKSVVYKKGLDSNYKTVSEFYARMNKNMAEVMKEKYGPFWSHKINADLPHEK